MARSLKVHFGGVRAIDGVTLTLGREEIVGLIGPNGAGKTTFVNALSGFLAPTAGEVTLNGNTTRGWTPTQFARKGLARTFQQIRPFAAMTVYENVAVAALGVGMQPTAAREYAQHLLLILRLESLAERRASQLALGDCRRLGLARALAIKPSFLLLDEPAAGLNELESEELVVLLRSLPKDFHLGVLLIEHDMKVVMGACERIHVLDHGKEISNGSPDYVQKDPKVLRAYLGSASTRQVEEWHADG